LVQEQLDIHGRILRRLRGEKIEREALSKATPLEQSTYISLYRLPLEQSLLLQDIEEGYKDKELEVNNFEEHSPTTLSDKSEENINRSNNILRGITSLTPRVLV